MASEPMSAIDQERALLEGLAKDMAAGRVIGATVREGEALTEVLAALRSSPSREDREQGYKAAFEAGRLRAEVFIAMHDESDDPDECADSAAVVAQDLARLAAESRRLLQLDPTPTEGTK